MNGLRDRVMADLDDLNRLARQVLGETRIPPAGSWARCWDLKEEHAVGEWHLIAATDGALRVSYRCARVGIVTVLTAIRARQRFTIQERDDPPEDAACWWCLRGG